jgi:hypothetical protein
MREVSPSTSFWTRLAQLRTTVGFYLDDIQTPLGVAIDVIITLLVLVSVGVFVAETYALPLQIRTFLDALQCCGFLWWSMCYGSGAPRTVCVLFLISIP